MEFGERDGAHLTTDTFALSRRDLRQAVDPPRRQERRPLARADGGRRVRPLAEPRAEDELRHRVRARRRRVPDGGRPVRQAAGAARDRPRRAARRGRRSARPARRRAASRRRCAPKTTRFGPFRIQKGRFAIGRGPTGDGLDQLRADDQRRPRHRAVQPRRRPHRDEPRPPRRRRRAQPRPARLGLRVQAPDRHRGQDRRQVDPRRRVPPPRPRQGRVRRRARAVVRRASRSRPIGIVNTKAPEPAGWSFLLLLFAEFRHSPWQIGLGFNITAVGGIIGLQHRASVDELRRSLGTNVYDDILFPADPVKDAPRIIGRLRTVFPVEPNGLVVGPTVEINWGTPAIVTGRFAHPRPVRRRVRRRRLPLHAR